MISVTVLAGTALRDLAQLGEKIENYPRTTRGLAIRVLEKQKPILKDKLKDRMVKELRALGGGFTEGSLVEKNMVVTDGGGSRGVSSFEVKVLGAKAAIIANAWNKGARIIPKAQYLAQPLSDAKKLDTQTLLSAYPKSDYTTWLYKKPMTLNPHSAVQQDVAGILQIRSRNSRVLGKRKDSRTGKVYNTIVPEPVARYLMLNKQIIKPTRWVFKAFNDFRNKDFPDVARQMIADMAKI